MRVTPGAWYAGSARVSLGSGVDAAWMRIAWYASADGSGSQLSTSDSEPLAGAGAAGDVVAGPAQAPLEAHSAAVRIMLRPLVAGVAQLTVDGCFDARGTLGVDRSATVGVTDLVVTVVLDTDADDTTLERLARSTERYCVVGQSLREEVRFVVRRAE